MTSGRHLAAAALAACFTGGPALATDLEEVVGQYMVGQALLAAHLVAVAEKAGMPPAEINAILEEVAERSIIAEFWITDSNGHAYLTNGDADFTFEPDPARQPQASAFWLLVAGDAEVVIQEAQRREIDDQVFKYVGVAGVDKPRIVQVGVNAADLPASR